MDYLVEEVLQQQSASIQAFLLRTSILERLCGPLCHAVMLDAAVSGQETLEFLNAPTCLSSPWTISGAGTAITASLQIC